MRKNLKPLKSAFLTGLKSVRGSLPLLYFPFGDNMWFLSSSSVHNNFEAFRPIIWAVIPSTSARSAPFLGPCGIGRIHSLYLPTVFGVGRNAPNFPTSAEHKVKMTEPKSSNLSVNEKLSRNLSNQVQQLDLKLFWYMDFRLKSRTQSQDDGTQVQQLECEWKIVKKFTEPGPKTWFEIVLIYGIQVEKPKTELKWRNPSPSTWVWMRNCQ